MPKTTKSGRPRSELPHLAALRREGAGHFAKAHDSALKSYEGDERAANQVGFSALKHTHEKVGDRWEPKENKGPSDPQAEGGRTPTGRRPAEWTPMPPRSTCTSWQPGSTSQAARR